LGENRGGFEQVIVREANKAYKLKQLTDEEINVIINSILYYYKHIEPRADILTIKERLSKKDVMIFIGVV